MSDNSKIQWTDATWNVLAGCSKVSAGCKNCYAIPHARRMEGNPNPKIAGKYAGTTAATSLNWSGRVNFAEHVLDWPLHKRKPLRIFVNSMSDLFHESVPDEWIDRIFAVMALAPQHTFQVLTKRAERMREYMERNATGGRIFHVASQIGRPQSGRWPLPNVWLGVSVEDQKAADERIPALKKTLAALWWLSVEPMLGPVDLMKLYPDADARWSRSVALSATLFGGQRLRGVDWVVVGGESGNNARPLNVEWARRVVRQCRDAGVPVFIKQLGLWPYSSKRGGPFQAQWAKDVERGPSRYFATFKDSHGGDIDEWPADLRIREMPQVTHAV